MLSTATMVRLGRVLSHWMVCVQVTNQKLRKRAQGIVMRLTGASEMAAARALRESGDNLPVALLMLLKQIPRAEAARQIEQGPSAAKVLREAMRK